MRPTELRQKMTFTISVAAVLLAVAARNIALSAGQQEQREPAPASKEAVSYACPMLCVPPSDSPGKCPVCGMNLEKVDEATGPAGSSAIAMSERSRALSRVETSEVRRQEASVEVRLAGRVDVDETRVEKVAARIDGRIDELYADFTGKTIREGEPLFLLYSPELMSAQEEFLQALQSGESVTSAPARDKLRLLGVTPGQIAEIEKRGKAFERLAFLSPSDGTILSKRAIKGAYAKEGDELFTIADLSKVWVVVDAYESDLPLLRLGQDAEVSVDSLPGESFKASVVFIDPVVESRTRSAKLRLEVDNSGARLKPGMLARAVVKARVDATGRPVESDVGVDDPILIPDRAPLLTGKRAVVYVETETEGEYAARTVLLGPKVGENYVVLEGLSGGEQVVTRGNFRIDSALQIMGRPSMMLPLESKDPDVSGVPETVGSQTKCPVMGGEINKEVFVDHDGYRIYFCCPGCDATFKADPDKYIKQMLADGVALETAPRE